MTAPNSARSLFDEIDDPKERIERLAREAFSLYERGAPQLGAIRNEPGVHPNVAEAGNEVEASLTAVVRAMIDLGTWDALRAQQVGGTEAVAGDR